MDGEGDNQSSIHTDTDLDDSQDSAAESGDEEQKTGEILSSEIDGTNINAALALANKTVRSAPKPLY